MYLTSLPRSRSSCYGEAWPQKMEPSSAVACKQGGCTSTIGSPTNRYNLLYNQALWQKLNCCLLLLHDLSEVVTTSIVSKIIQF